MVVGRAACDARGNEPPPFLRGTTVTCTNCGAAQGSTATTCTVCGADLASQTQPAASSSPTSSSPVSTWSPPPGEGDPVWGSAAAPHPSGLPSDVRNWGLAAHLSAYLGAWVGLAFLGPLVVWLVKRDDHPFIDHHGKEALNFNISVLLYGVIGVVIAIPVGLLTLGIGLIPLVIVGVALAVVWVVFPILAAIKAANGEGYRYPLTIRFVS
jgi:uncharacterized protein